MLLNARETFWKTLHKIRFFCSHNKDRLRRKFFLYFESARYANVSPHKDQFFWIVSCERNVGSDAIKCLESIYRQNYDKTKYVHLFIDDHSNNGTKELIEAWLEQHPDHNVRFIARTKRVGGTANTVDGFRMAPAEAIVLEVNGDDWLPDSDVLNFLNKVYDNPQVWMTYNTFMYSDGRSPEHNHPYPQCIVTKGDYRNYTKWVGQHLHTFRAPLFSHLAEETFIDPQTGEYWESADDQAIYLSLLELSGIHARHIYRTTYIYNYHESADDKLDHSGSVDRASRIRAMDKYQQLDRL